MSGLGAPFFIDHSHARAREGRIVARSRLVVLCQRIQALLCQNHQICGFTGLHTFDQDCGRSPGDIELVAGRLLKLGRQFFEGCRTPMVLKTLTSAAVTRPACAIRKTTIAARRLIVLLMTSPLLWQSLHA
jgi:hypothetical protein